MRLARSVLVVLPRAELAARAVVDSAMFACAPTSLSTAPERPWSRWRDRVTTLVTVAFAYLLCLAPLLHAHPASDAGSLRPPADAHPVGIHLPEQTRAPVFLAVDEDSPAPALTVDTRGLATIVVAESHRREGNPTPSRTDPPATLPARAAPTAAQRIRFDRADAASAPRMRAGRPAYFAQAPPASA